MNQLSTLLEDGADLSALPQVLLQTEEKVRKLARQYRGEHKERITNLLNQLYVTRRIFEDKYERRE